MMMSRDKHIRTRTVRAALESDTQYGAVVPPIHLTSTSGGCGIWYQSTDIRAAIEIGLVFCHRPDSLLETINLYSSLLSVTV